MSLTLNDLWVSHDAEDPKDDIERSASFADLVEVLTNEHGAEVHTASGESGFYDVRSHWEVSVPGPGRYLVVPIPGGTSDE